MIDESIKGLDLGGYKPKVAVPNQLSDLTDGNRVATNEQNIATLQGQVNTHNGEIANLSNEVANKASVQYVDQKFNGASKAIAYDSYSTMITAFNALGADVYAIGQDVLIQTLQVPDLWVSGIESASVQYTYVDDATFTAELAQNGYVQVGYYKLSALETQKVDLTNYQEKLTAGTNISIIGNVISATGGTPANMMTTDADTQTITGGKTKTLKFTAGADNTGLKITSNEESANYVAITPANTNVYNNPEVAIGIGKGSGTSGIYRASYRADGIKLATGSGNAWKTLFLKFPTSETGEKTIALTSDITAKVPNAPTTDGTYVLKAVVSNGTPTYQWVLEA